MTDGPPRLTLVIGDEELLVERAISAVLAVARDADPETEITDTSAASASAEELFGLLSPALFGGRRCVVVRDVQDAGKELGSALPGLVSAADDAVIVVTHSGGARGKSLLDGLSGIADAVVRCVRLGTARERAEFVVAEVHAAGRRIDAGGVAAVQAAVGSDLRELANACAQLVADTTGPIRDVEVARYLRGRADATGFAVADRAVEGDLPGALEVLRWALGVGVAPVLVTSSLAANLRLIARVAGEGRSQPGRIAKALGQPGWKVDKALRWSRGWSPAGLSIAVRAVAVADGEVKGGAVDAAYAVERVVATVASNRSGR